MTSFVEEGPAARLKSMPKMPDAREHHGDPGVVGSFYHLVIADRSAGLDHRRGAGLDRDQQAIGERKERIRRHHRASCHWLRKLRFVGGILSLALGDAVGIHPAPFPPAAPAG